MSQILQLRFLIYLILLVNSRPETKQSIRIKKILLKRFHILQWLPKYTKNDIVADFVAGITVGMTMIPQAVAYAGLAGLEPQYGLYTAFMGSFAYVFFGTVKEVSIGPTSLMAFLTFSYLGGNYPIEFVILLTLLAGIVELALGLFKLGFLVDFISPSTISGFTSGTAVIIIGSQLKNFLGLKKMAGRGLFNTIKEICFRLTDIKIADTFLGVASIIFLILFKQIPKMQTESKPLKKFLWLLSISKNALVVFLGSFISFVFLNINNTRPFELTGSVPSGLPVFQLPQLSATYNNQTVNLWEMMKVLDSSIIVLPIIAVLANVAIAKAYCSDTVVDISQEMISLGLSNILGSFVKAMPSCGAFTRSSVASSSGVRTPLQGVYSGTVIILALSFLAPFFYYIPKSTLAAVLIIAAFTLIDVQIYITLWKCSKIEFAIATTTFFIAIFVNVEMSIIIGSILNALILLKFWNKPKIISRIQTTTEKINFIYIKPDLGLYYPAVDNFTETVKKIHRKNPMLTIIVDCTGLLQIDYSAAKGISNLIKTYKKTYASIGFLSMNKNVVKMLTTLMDRENLIVLQNSEEIDQFVTNANNGIQLKCPDQVEMSLIIESETDKKLSS